MSAKDFCYHHNLKGEEKILVETKTKSLTDIWFLVFWVFKSRAAYNGAGARTVNKEKWWKKNWTIQFLHPRNAWAIENKIVACDKKGTMFVKGF